MVEGRIANLGERMLKIKDDIDLKELEKFGFEYNEPENVWYRDLYTGYLWIKYNGILMLEDANCEAEDVIDIIYDLIEAGLVECV